MKRVGKGFFTKVVPLKSGGVAKFVTGQFAKTDAEKMVKAHTDYVTLLRKAGINVAETRINAKKRQTGTKLRILQAQRFRQEELGNNYLRNASKENAIWFAGKLVGLAIKTFSSNYKPSNQGKKISIDPKPTNVAVKDREVILIDTFPPFIVENPRAQEPAINLLKERVPGGRFFPKSSVKKFAHLVSYNPKRVIASLLYELSIFRPELKNEFVSVAIEKIKSNSTGKLREELLSGTSGGQILIAKIIGRIFSNLAKIRAK